MVKAMIKAGAEQAVFENGGDIALFIREPVVVGLYCGEKVKPLALKIKPRNSIFGIYKLSGRMGPSLSFGKADSVTVIAEDPALADALATALGNEIKEEDPQKIEASIEKFLRLGAEWIIVVIGNYIGLGGDLPEIISCPVPYSLIIGIQRPIRVFF